MRARRSSWLPGCPPPLNFEHFEEHFQRRFQSQSGLNQDDKKGRKAAWFPWRTNFQIFKDSLQCGFQDSPNLNQEERKDKVLLGFRDASNFQSSEDSFKGGFQDWQRSNQYDRNSEIKNERTPINSNPGWTEDFRNLHANLIRSRMRRGKRISDVTRPSCGEIVELREL
ncbi:hypothetical protein L5515_005830 [Caenorhabditis briggsae]|uniref:Uncharacterized protein n=1 Tax=Caenorhabditis briggsae TaxID=6238 RepID=A0AAE9EUD2_CAEBR|nr:hypothetical protein L5515_005830 [Caenorhabditis briggsae]